MDVPNLHGRQQAIRSVTRRRAREVLQNALKMADAACIAALLAECVPPAGSASAGNV